MLSPCISPGLIVKKNPCFLLLGETAGIFCVMIIGRVYVNADGNMRKRK